MMGRAAPAFRIVLLFHILKIHHIEVFNGPTHPYKKMQAEVKETNCISFEHVDTPGDGKEVGN